MYDLDFGIGFGLGNITGVLDTMTSLAIGLPVILIMAGVARIVLWVLLSSFMGQSAGLISKVIYYGALLAISAKGFEDPTFIFSLADYGYNMGIHFSSLIEGINSFDMNLENLFAFSFDINRFTLVMAIVLLVIALLLMVSWFYSRSSNSGYYNYSSRQSKWHQQSYEWEEDQWNWQEPERKTEEKSNYYSVLGLSFGASKEEIKAAYRRLVKIHHPDRGGDSNTFMRIQSAYEALIKAC